MNIKGFMQLPKETSVKSIKNYSIDEDKVDFNCMKNVINIDDSYQTYFFAEIELTGKYCRKYIFLSNFSNITERSICIDGDLMVVAICCSVVFYDLKEDKVIKIVDIDTWAEDCVKLEKGYFIHGELTNLFFNTNFEIVWEASCADIFENTKVPDVMEIGKDYIAIFDWLGVKWFYNENGEFKTEVYKEYNMNSDS